MSNTVFFRPGTTTPIDHGRVDRLAQRNRTGNFHRYAPVHDHGSSIIRFPDIQDDLGYFGGLPGFDEGLTKRDEPMGGRRLRKKPIKKKKKLKGKGVYKSHCHAGS